jgi:hypothetical protein
LCLKHLFLPPLVVHALLELLQLGFEHTNLGHRIVIRVSLSGRDKNAADQNAFQ